MSEGVTTARWIQVFANCSDALIGIQVQRRIAAGSGSNIRRSEGCCSSTLSGYSVVETDRGAL